MLPHALNDWSLDADGAAPDHDLFDVDTWREFGWGPLDPQVMVRVASRGEPPSGAGRVELPQSKSGRSLERAASPVR